MLDPDRKPVGPDPIARAEAEIGRPAGAQPGDEFALNLPLPLTNAPIKSAELKTVVFHLLVDDVELAHLPLKLRRAVQVEAYQR